MLISQEYRLEEEDELEGDEESLDDLDEEDFLLDEDDELGEQQRAAAKARRVQLEGAPFAPALQQQQRKQQQGPTDDQWDQVCINCNLLHLVLLQAASIPSVYSGGHQDRM